MRISGGAVCILSVATAVILVTNQWASADPQCAVPETQRRLIVHLDQQIRLLRHCSPWSIRSCERHADNGDAWKLKIGNGCKYEMHPM